MPKEDNNAWPDIKSACSRWLLNNEKNSKKSFKRLKALVKTKCPHCGEPQKKLKFLKPTTYIENGTTLSPVQVREKLEKIPNSDLIYLGLKVRPELFIITLLPPKVKTIQQQSCKNVKIKYQNAKLQIKVQK